MNELLVRASLKRIVANADLDGSALKAFTDWPTLEHVALQFLHFVPPWLIVENESLAEVTIKNALVAYDSNHGNGFDVGHRKFIEKIAESANVLSSLRVSVRNDMDQWDIWNYDQPLTEYMQDHKRWSIQIRLRETPVPTGPVMIKLLAAISSTQEMLSADIDILSLFSGRVMQ